MALCEIKSFFGLKDDFANAGYAERTDYIYWLLSQCAKDGVKPENLFTKEAMDILNQNLNTPFEINKYAREALVEAWRQKQKPVRVENVKEVLAKLAKGWI